MGTDDDKKPQQRESIQLWALNEIHLDDFYVKRVEADGRVCYVRDVYRPDLPDFFWEDDLNKARQNRQEAERQAVSSGELARVARGIQGRLLSQEIANNPNIGALTSSAEESQKRRGAGQGKQKKEKK